MDYPILAIDYGDKHFGLAVSDYKGILATPLDIVSISQNRTAEDVITDILNYAEEYKAKTLLIGQPQPFEIQQKRTNKKIDKFIELIKQRTDLPIITQDESYSTSNAQNMLKETGQNIKGTRGKIDKVAATVFLQEFLDSNK
ncbi:Holliday junction resolvase RuvX [bacterium]|nr:Holliday junction resolvase RuvX [bacterium]